MTPLDYLKLGWFLLPLHRALPDGHCSCGRRPCPDKPGKHPRTEHGQKDASNDPAQISDWIKRWPETNWGVHCQLSGFCAVDVDPRDGGDKTFNALVEKHGPLPAGPVQFTGGSGWHYLLKPPSNLILRGSLGKASGIQIKYNGYIVIEPSNHESGKTYVWQAAADLEIPEIPAGWLETLTRRDTVHRPVNYKPSDESEFESALFAIPNNDVDYDTWISIGMSVKAAVGDNGYALWDRWSQQSSKYHEPSLIKKWPSFNQSGGITGNTVYGLARKEGWRPVTKLRAVPTPPPDMDEPPPIDDDDIPSDICDEVIDLGPRSPEQSYSKRPLIQISVDMERVINAAEDAILSMPRRNLYQRAGNIVRIAKDSQPPDGITRPTGATAIKTCPTPHLHELCSRAADWEKFDKRSVSKECDGWLPSLPPQWVVNSLAARGQWRFPPIISVVAAPTIRPDGSILDDPGYDERTGLLYLTGGIVFPHIPTSPTREDAHKALVTLAEPFIDFPFTARCDKSAALAAVLSLVCRAAITGPVPLFAARATTAGTGKSLLADIVSIIGTGRPAARWAQSQTEDEERKRLLALAIEGDPIIVLDNITRQLGSGALDMAITAGTVKDRLLGSTQNAEAPWRAVVIATGNNLQVRGDMARRVQPIDMDAVMERPEERSGWVHPDVVAWTLAERPRLVQAALTAVRAYAVAGWPDTGAIPIGSFESYCRIVRNTIIWAGWPDPAESRERIRQDSDPDLDMLRDVMRTWHAHYGAREMVLSDVALELLDERMTTASGSALRTALEDATRGRKGSLSTRTAYYLRRYKGRIMDRLRLDTGVRCGAGTPWVVYEIA